MQRLSRKRIQRIVAGASRAVSAVADQWVTDVAHMHPDLVRTAGFQSALDQRRQRKAFPHHVMRQGPTAGLDHRHAGSTHRMPPDGTLEEKFALRHDVTFTKGGPFHRIMGSDVVRTNTLHGQGIKATGERIVIDGIAPDGTPEAIYIEGAPGFAFGVQWHPEYRAAEDPVSRPLFEAFGGALRAWAAGERTSHLRSA